MAGDVAQRTDLRLNLGVFGDRPGDEEGLQQRWLAEGQFIRRIVAQAQLPKIAVANLGSQPKGVLRNEGKIVNGIGQVRHTARALRALSGTDQDRGRMLIHRFSV